MKQIAIRVENKTQFDAVKQYHATLGTHFPNRDFIVDSFPCHITKYSSNMAWVREEQLNDFEAIYFDVFSQLTGVKAVVEIEIKLLNDSVANVFEHHIEFNGSPVDRLEALELEAIYTAYKALQ